MIEGGGGLTSELIYLLKFGGGGLGMPGNPGGGPVGLKF